MSLRGTVPPRRFPALLAVAAVCTASMALSSGIAAGPQDTRTPPRSVPDRPGTDVSAPGVLAGRVTLEDGRPLRRVEVRARRDAGVPTEVQAVTDHEGRYEIANAPAGLWTLAFSRPGYLDQTGRSPHTVRSVRLPTGGVTAVDATLVPGAAIAGFVFDELGDPVAGTIVEAMRVRYVDGARRLTSVARDQTDDTGAFRLHTLPAGSYFVAARRRLTAPEESGAPATAIPSFFPGTASLSEARRIAVRTGEGRSGVTFLLSAAHAVRLAGVVMDSSGRATDDAPVELLSPLDGEVVTRAFGNFGLTQDGGRFAMINVPPGNYLISSRLDRADTGARETAFMPVSVGSSDVSVTVTTAPAAIVTGRISASPPVALPPKFEAVVVAAPARDGGRSVSAAVDPKGTFELEGVAGSVVLSISGLPRGWALQRIEVGGQDVTDVPVSFAPGSKAAAEVVLTNRVTAVTGTIFRNGAVMPDAAVLVFAADGARWPMPSRFVRIVRADREGRFTAEGLPAGDYLALALSNADDGEWFDAEQLSQLRPHAVALRLEAGMPVTLDLAPLER